MIMSYRVIYCWITTLLGMKSQSVLACLLTHPHSLHLRPERIQQLKQDQTQRVNVHFVRVRVSREL